ncbi:hypothetical protein B0T25DRAFT_519972 [Lasiosphaeria hispida]|uniref:Uncharacterized protein n=1 Tax=Lasiosphaeria hispida TaxID=260671 RepID=A0AAJ0MCU1_9PEZI|nr:hypothetical protein B0T25DRAFT_519972 [Lasiosphaeria hispida]
MDPLSILAIAAAVGQFVDFGGRILVWTWDTYKGRDAGSGWKPSTARSCRLFCLSSGAFNLCVDSTGTTGALVRHDAKRLANWELEFSNQIEQITSTLKRVDEHTKTSSAAGREPEDAPGSGLLRS